MDSTSRRTHGRQDVEEQVIDSLMKSELVDGLIVVAVNGDYYNRSLLRLVLERVPLVLADRALNGIATLGPLLGLFGTVIGMIRALHALSAHAGPGKTELLAQGIALALMATASGLAVAIVSAAGI